MFYKNINDDIILLLVSKDGIVETRTLEIDKNFQNENVIFKKQCEGDNDNVHQIANTINRVLKAKLPNKTFNYCKDLDKAYQSVHVNIESDIQQILNSRELIYTNSRNAITENRDYNLSENIAALKSSVLAKLELWFKVFDVEFAYEQAKKVSNMLVYSHRISGWSSPEYKITENLKQEVKTNFGYGSASYFYVLLTYKNIQLTPLSEWTDYRYANFSEVIRYTRSFKGKIAVFDDKGRLRYWKTKIENSYWQNALQFTRTAANLSLQNENEFIEKFVISECEAMVSGLENFYRETRFDFINETVNNENESGNKYRVDINGYELIDFRTEKIIGALDFLKKIIEYNSIIPTDNYTTRIIELNKKFFPNVLSALEEQAEELNKAKKQYQYFIIGHNNLVEKNKFYQKERILLKNNFQDRYNDDYRDFQLQFEKSCADLKQHNHKVKLHTDNVEKLSKHILKYNEIVK